MAIRNPSFTQYPNDIFDYYLDILSGNAFKIVSIIIRKTKGWGKTVDFISTSQMTEMTGIDKKSVWRAVNELMDLGLIDKLVIGKGKVRKTLYQLQIDETQDKYENDFERFLKKQSLETKKDILSQLTIEDIEGTMPHIMGAHGPNISGFNGGTMPHTKERVKENFKQRKKDFLKASNIGKREQSGARIMETMIKAKKMRDELLNHVEGNHEKENQ